MATGSITSAGLGSGIDIESLITKLMTLERTPITQLESRQSSFQTKLSSYGTLKSTLSSLQDAAEKLQTRDSFAARTATIADSSIATVSASSSASAGSYSLSVEALAQNQKVRSTGYADGATIATGTLTLTLGNYNADTTTFTADAARTFSITINSSNNTLEGLRDAINAKKAGVTATIIDNGTTQQLSLSSDSSGADNAFKLSGLTGFDFTPGAASTLTSTQTAQDAKFTLDGIQIKRSSNTITDVADGLTINLKSKTAAATTTTISVATDTTAMLKQINDFVSAYNSAVGLMGSQTSYDATTKKGGPLNGENSVRSMQSQLRSIVGGAVGSTDGFSRLSDVGISVGVNGKLTVDSTKLEAALKDPTKDVASLFIEEGGVKGFAAKLADSVEAMLDTDGTLTARTDGLTKSISAIDDRISKLETRLETVEARYRRQFSAMDSMIASLNSTSTFLTQQLASLSS
ncbi:flagellar filament capping protein FliD [Viridibacterium curvum]|uniref:Flagellar hook-associated protein 2 n=1 Tax=Viridibacterium curvum TaxID=1101404 RepID=A0ABP9QCW4_9RHOO